MTLLRVGTGLIGLPTHCCMYIVCVKCKLVTSVEAIKVNTAYQFLP